MLSLYAQLINFKMDTQYKIWNTQLRIISLPIWSTQFSEKKGG